MTELNKGQRVIVTNLLGQEFKGLLVNINDDREPSMKYAVETGGGDIVFVGDKDIRPDKAKQEVKVSKPKRRRPLGDSSKLDTEGCLALASEILLSAMEAYKTELRLSLKNFTLTPESKTIEKFFLSEGGQLLSFDTGRQIIEKCRREVFGRDGIVFEDGKIKGKLEIGSWRRRRVDQYSMSGKYICTYESAAAAAKALGLQTTNICSCCRGYLKSSGGYRWKYTVIDMPKKDKTKKR